jgi:hypothetical protein
MLRLVVMMQLSNEATDADVTAIIDGLEELPGLVPEIRGYSIGRDAGLIEGNYHLVVVGEFDDEEGFARYSSNDDHQAVIAERIRPFMTSRSAVQYFLD